MCVCVCVCVYVYIYICICICIYSPSFIPIYWKHFVSKMVSEAKTVKEDR